jgi:hypothetical protein
VLLPRFRVLKRRITFRGVEKPMAKLEKLIYKNANEQLDPEDLQGEYELAAIYQTNPDN